MNKQLMPKLVQAIEKYNEVQSNEELHLDWWEVVCSINCLQDDKEVASAIFDIENETQLLRLVTKK